MLSKNVNNKKCAPKFVFFNEKKNILILYPSLENSTTGIAITKGYTHATSLYASDSSVSTSAASTPSMMSLADGVGIAYDIVGHILEEVMK